MVYGLTSYASQTPLKPVIITDLVTQWPAYKNWTSAYLSANCGSTPFIAGPLNIKLDDYFHYANATQEESPFYVFDKHFGEKAPNLAADYTVPEYFSEDLFSVLGKQRPDYRWLIIGPARSGSNFHIDPNSTNAWNAVITGRKKWVMYPPHVTPPGIFPSADGSEVTSPVSILYVN